MKTLNSVKEYVKGFEALRLKAYKCPGGVWTLGYGTTVLPSGERVKEGMTCTKDEALMYFEHDIGMVEGQLNMVLHDVILNVNQFSALVSLVYNIGIGNFNKSKVKQFLKYGDFYYAGEHFIDHSFAWSKKKAKYIELAGLVTRRKKEMEIFKTPVKDEPKKLISLIDALKAKTYMYIYKGNYVPLKFDMETL